MESQGLSCQPPGDSDFSRSLLAPPAGLAIGARVAVQRRWRPTEHALALLVSLPSHGGTGVSLVQTSGIGASLSLSACAAIFCFLVERHVQFCGCAWGSLSSCRACRCAEVRQADVGPGVRAEGRGDACRRPGPGGVRATSRRRPCSWPPSAHRAGVLFQPPSCAGSSGCDSAIFHVFLPTSRPRTERTCPRGRGLSTEMERGAGGRRPAGGAQPGVHSRGCSRCHHGGVGTACGHGSER